MATKGATFTGHYNSLQAASGGLFIYFPSSLCLTLVMQIKKKNIRYTKLRVIGKTQCRMNFGTEANISCFFLALKLKKKKLGSSSLTLGLSEIYCC